MIDLHSHILHGVDDGASSLDESLEICRRALADGCRAMVATPHLRQEHYWNDDTELLAERFAALRTAVRRAFGDDFAVHFGGEIALHSESLAEIDALPGGALPTLAGSRYVLLELPWRAMGPDPVETVHELVVRGLVPIIAHPERVSWLVRDVGLQAALISHGALFQLTAMSVVGELGSVVLEASERMLEQGWVHFLASDAHDPALRKPGLSQARDMVARRFGAAAARALVDEHPRMVVEDLPFEPATVPEVEARDGLLSGFARRLRTRSS